MRRALTAAGAGHRSRVVAISRIIVFLMAENCLPVMVGMEEDEATFLQAVSEGVVGYVLKDASAAEIVRVIRAVAAGEASPRRILCVQSVAKDEVRLESEGAA